MKTSDRFSVLRTVSLLSDGASNISHTTGEIKKLAARNDFAPQDSIWLLTRSTDVLSDLISATAEERKERHLTNEETQIVKETVIEIAQKISTLATSQTIGSYSLGDRFALLFEDMDAYQFPSTPDATSWRKGVLEKTAPFFTMLAGSRRFEEVNAVSDILSGEGKTQDEFVTAEHFRLMQALVENPPRPSLMGTYFAVALLAGNRAQFVKEGEPLLETPEAQAEREVFMAFLNDQSVAKALSRADSDWIVEQNIVKTMTSVEFSTMRLTNQAILTQEPAGRYVQRKDNGEWYWYELLEERKRTRYLPVAQWVKNNAQKFILEHFDAFVEGEILEEATAMLQYTAPEGMDRTVISAGISRYMEEMTTGIQAVDMIAYDKSELPTPENVKETEEIFINEKTGAYLLRKTAYLMSRGVEDLQETFGNMTWEEFLSGAQQPLATLQQRIGGFLPHPNQYMVSLSIANDIYHRFLFQKSAIDEVRRRGQTTEKS